MKPNKVSLCCCNKNSYLLGFWEHVARLWEYKFRIGCNSFASKAEHNIVTVIKSLDSVPVHTQTQYARFYLGCHSLRSCLIYEKEIEKILSLSIIII